MKFLFTFISSMLLSSSIPSASEWLYYKEYPWVYDAKTEDWLYLQGGTDKKIYAYRASTKVWEEFKIALNFSNTVEEAKVTILVEKIGKDPDNPATEIKVESAENLEMIWVDSGSFFMGNDNQILINENGQSAEYNVILSKGFYLGKYEVTQKQYQKVMENNSFQLNSTPSFSIGQNKPVENVSWDDINIFLSILNKKESSTLPAGWKYALPTGAQWEYSCKAGTKTLYSWGDRINSSNANYGQFTGGTKDVGQYPPNPWGFCDMHGNVKEWTATKYDGSTVLPSQYPLTDPIGPVNGVFGIVRGGSYFVGAWFLYSYYRDHYPLEWKEGDIGFRLCLSESN